MKLKHKIYLRINLTTIIFIIVSCISATLAWFAYSGLSDVKTDVNVKAWYIELKRNNKVVSNDIDIALDDIYPGMKTVYETININNKGDSDAQISYAVDSANILNIDNYATNSGDLEDVLSHKYPFHINISLSKNFAVAKSGESVFTVSISWPLDSGNDESDSYWGKEAYNYQNGNNGKSISVKIKLKAEQYVEDDSTSDSKYYLGNMIYYDVVNNQKCSGESDNCKKMHVIDSNNTLEDTKVTLLPDLSYFTNTSNFNNYSSSVSNWSTSNRTLTNKDILKSISTDIVKSFLVRENLSDSVIGNLAYGNRIDTELSKFNSTSYYKFDNINFVYLTSNTCYWTNTSFDADTAFAIKKIDDNNSKLYLENKNTPCLNIPVIEVNKTNLE